MVRPPAVGSAAFAPSGQSVRKRDVDVLQLRIFVEAVAAEFAARSSALVAYLKANADAKAVVSGFNDPTGDPAKNAELSKQRAQAVQAALVAQGIAQDRTVLEKPVDPTGTGISNAAARRVDVVVRP